MRNRILINHLHPQLIPHKTPRTLPTKQVLRANRLFRRTINMRQLNFNRIRLIRPIIFEPRNRPRPLNSIAVFLNILDKHPLNQALVKKRRERIPRIDELWTTSPRPRSVYALFYRVPESNFVYLCRLVLHDLALEAHIAQEV
jgi:hypothetical protein